MSKVYILYPKVLKGIEADNYYREHCFEATRLPDEDLESKFVIKKINDKPTEKNLPA